MKLYLLALALIVGLFAPSAMAQPIGTPPPVAAATTPPAAAAPPAEKSWWETEADKP
jgi:hypothetical protein